VRNGAWFGWLLALAACGGNTPSGPTEPKAIKADKVVKMVTPSRLVPEIDSNGVAAWFDERGRAKHLLAGLRMVVHDDGHVVRANERFPSGAVTALPLPMRLGGGYAFYQSDSQGTRLWRADTWTAKLKPLSYIGPATDELVPGFDRLYLRTKANKVMALDPETGAIMGLGQMPAAASFGPMAFADGWRAVVDTDLRGPMASFDAGATWRPLSISQRVLSAAVVEGDPVLYVDDGYFRVDVSGQLSFVRSDQAPPEDIEEDGDDPGEPLADGHPLGRRPLRVAIEHGYPDSTTSAVVAYRGALVRVSLPDAKVTSINPEALPDETARCTGARVLRGFGFVCGAEGGKTTIYRFSPPLSLEVVAQFDNPRFVSDSGNGALVVRGKCGVEEGEADDMRTYCVIGSDGTQREIAVRGEIGAERVVALTDGRVVVLVPPRLGRTGRLTIIDGDKLDSKELKYPAEPRRAVKIARRGLWLEGFQQHGKGAVRGWVEAGGPAVGVSVKLDGTVSLGEVYDDGGQLLVSGPFAIAVTDAEHGFESVNGGERWREFELPRLPESPGDARTRGCSAVGCTLRGWLRVGWGATGVEEDLQNVDPPEGASVRPVVRDPLRLTCALVSASKKQFREHKSVGGRAPFSTWAAFRGTAPPALARDQLGVDKASLHTDPVPAHVYVWGPKGADWTRAGSWIVRFDDRYDSDDGVRTSATSRPPWADENSASEAIGARHRGSYWRWEAVMDPGGKAAIASLCTGQRCLPHAVAEGRPVVPLRMAPGIDQKLFRKPVEGGAVRIGETWYLLGTLPRAMTMTLWRAELGVLHRAVELRRLDQRHHQMASAPRLVRRALGGELGVLLVAPPDPASGSHVGTWHVLPLNPNSGELGAPVSLGKADLDGVIPRRCEEHDDGWLLDTRLAVNPAIDLVGVHGYVEDIEVRLRLDPGSQCIDAIAAKAGRTFAVSEDAASAARTGIRMAVRDRYTGRRWRMSCSASD
jgi:hypothetical protein